jgi:hypothetical protein
VLEELQSRIMGAAAGGAGGADGGAGGGMNGGAAGGAAFDDPLLHEPGSRTREAGAEGRGQLVGAVPLRFVGWPCRWSGFSGCWLGIG